MLNSGDIGTLFRFACFCSVNMLYMSNLSSDIYGNLSVLGSSDTRIVNLSCNAFFFLSLLLIVITKSGIVLYWEKTMRLLSMGDMGDA